MKIEAQAYDFVNMSSSFSEVRSVSGRDNLYGSLYRLIE